MDLLKSRRSFILCFFVVWGFSSKVRNDIQEAQIQLEYMYTYYNSSFYEVVGMFDGEVVDVNRTDLKFPIPKKEWNSKQGTFGYTGWTESLPRRRFIDGIVFPRYAEKITNRMQISTQEAAIVQMRLGCISEGPKGQHNSFAELAFNGETIFYYNQRSLVDHHQKDVWVPLRYPDHDGHGKFVAQILNYDKPDLWTKYRDELSNFINSDCPRALGRFQEYEKTNKSKVTDIRTGVGLGRRNLSCLVSGFYPKSAPINMRWFKNDVPLTEGIWSTGVRPNDNHTYQLRSGVDVTNVTDVQSDVYRCEVNYSVDFSPKNCTWGTTPPTPAYWVFALVFVLGVVVLVLVTWCRKRGGKKDLKNAGSQSTSVSSLMSTSSSLPVDLHLQQSPLMSTSSSLPVDVHLQ